MVVSERLVSGPASIQVVYVRESKGCQMSLPLNACVIKLCPNMLRERDPKSWCDALLASHLLPPLFNDLHSINLPLEPRESPPEVLVAGPGTHDHPLLCRDQRSRRRRRFGNEHGSTPILAIQRPPEYLQQIHDVLLLNGLRKGLWLIHAAEYATGRAVNLGVASTLAIIVN